MDLNDIFSGPITPAKWRMLGEYLQTSKVTAGKGLKFRHVGNKTILSAKRAGSGSPRPLMPFEVTCEKDGASWKCKVARGVVAERVVDEDVDTVIYWVPEGMLDEEDESIALTITDGQGVFVVVNVSESGQIEEDGVTIEVLDADGISVNHFTPSVADESGTAGVYKYRLGKVAITTEPDECKFTPDMAGSNISHWVDLPQFEKEAGDFDIFKKFNLSEKKYKTKGITADLGESETATIKITDTGDELKFATDGANLNLLINHYIENDVTGVCSLSYTSCLYWRNGLFIGSTSPADEPEDLIEETVADVQPTEE